MATFIPEKVSPEPVASEVRPVARDGKVHNGPVARLLTKVSKWHGEYIDYQMESGVWRKLSL